MTTAILYILAGLVYLPTEFMAWFVLASWFGFRLGQRRGLAGSIHDEVQGALSDAFRGSENLWTETLDRADGIHPSLSWIASVVAWPLGAAFAIVRIGEVRSSLAWHLDHRS